MIGRPALPLPYYLKIKISVAAIMKSSGLFHGRGMRISLPGKRPAVLKIIRGSGHFSGRLTVALVAAGVIAKKLMLTSMKEGKAMVSATILEIGGETDLEKGLAKSDRPKRFDRRDYRMPRKWIARWIGRAVL